MNYENELFRSDYRLFESDVIAYDDYMRSVEKTGSTDFKKISDAEKFLISKYGINIDALRAARAYLAMPEDERQRFDLSYLLSIRALDKECQLDMFVAALLEDAEADELNVRALKAL